MPQLIALLLILFTQAGPPSAIGSPEELDRRPGRGEQCLVCGERITGEEVVELRYRGRRFHVAAPLLADFHADPARYFTRLQARSALFDEAALGDGAMTSGWLWFGLYVLAGLVASAVCGSIAVGKALAPLPWFFAGLLGNVAAVAVLLITPRGDASALPAGIPGGLRKVPCTRVPVPCPACGAASHPAARRCAGCGADLEPSAVAERDRIGGGP